MKQSRDAKIIPAPLQNRVRGCLETRGLGFGVWGLGVGVWGLGFWGFEVLGCGVWGLSVPFVSGCLWIPVSRSKFLCRSECDPRFRYLTCMWISEAGFLAEACTFHRFFDHVLYNDVRFHSYSYPKCLELLHYGKLPRDI